MPDIRIFPATSCISVTGSVVMQGSGSTTVPSIFTVAGCAGALLSVTDDLSTSIFSANTIAGLPVIEAYSNSCVNIGQFNGHKLTVTSTAIVGGQYNTTCGKCSFMGGGCCNFTSGSYNVLSGGRLNRIETPYSTLSGGYGNCIIGGAAEYGGACATLSGGYYNTISGYGGAAVIGGGYGNCVLGTNGVIGGGYGNKVNGDESVVAGGQNNYICPGIDYASIGGGWANRIESSYSTVGGGIINRNWAGSIGSVIAGGICNTNYGSYSSVVGGRNNTISVYCNAHIIGSYISAVASNYTFVNTLCQYGGGISDCRLKNNIQDTCFGLDDITKLRPVSFCWNGDKSCHRKYGFISQEVQQAMPCIVETNCIDKVDEKGFRNFEKGDPVLQFEKDAIYSSYVNAFKELKAKIESLEERVRVLESR